MIEKITPDLTSRTDHGMQLARAFEEKNDLNSAEKECLKVVEYSLQETDSDLKMKILDDCAKFLMKLENWKEAERVFKIMYVYYMKTSNDSWKASIAIKIVQCMLVEVGNSELSLSYLKNAEALFIKLKDEIGLASVNYYKAFCFYYLQKIPQSIETANKCLNYLSNKPMVKPDILRFLLSICYCIENNMEMANKNFDSINKAYFQNLLTCKFKKSELNNSDLIRNIFTRVRDRLIVIINEKDLNKLKICMSEYVWLFVKIVSTYHHVQDQTIFQKAWDICRPIVEMAIRQDSTDIDQLYKECVISQKLTFSLSVSLIEAVVEHMYHMAYAIAGHDIKGLLIKHDQNSSKHNALIISLNNSNCFRILFSGLEKDEKNIIVMTAARQDVLDRHLSASLGAITLFRMKQFSLKSKKIPYPVMIDSQKYLENPCSKFTLNIITYLRNIFIGLYSQAEAIILFKFGSNSQEMRHIDYYFHYLLFGYYHLTLNYLNGLQDSELEPIIEQSCLMFQNFFPTKLDYILDWIDRFDIEINTSEFLRNKILDQGSIVPKLSLFKAVIELMCRLCFAKEIQDQVPFESIKKDLKHISREVTKAYRDLGMLTLYNYRRELEQIDSKIKFKVDFEGLVLTFSYKAVSEIFEEILVKRDFDYEKIGEFEFRINDFRSQNRKLTMLGYNLSRIIYEKTNNSNNLIVQPQAKANKIDIPAPDQEDKDFEKNSPADVVENQEKITKNEKKTNEIKQILQFKKLEREAKSYQKAKSYHNNSDQNHKKKSNLREKPVVDTSVKYKNSSDIALKTQEQGADVFVQMRNNEVKETLVNIKIKKINRREEMLQIAINHGNELNRIYLLFQKTTKITDKTLYLFLYHAIRMLHAIGWFSQNTIVAKIVDPSLVRFFRNILLHRWDYFFNHFNFKLLISENKGALIHFLIKLLQILKKASDHPLSEVESIDLSENSIYNIFYTGSSLKLQVATKSATQWLEIIFADMSVIEELLREVPMTQDKFEKADIITEIKMRLVKIGCIVKELRKKQSRLFRSI